MDSTAGTFDDEWAKLASYRGPWGTTIENAGMTKRQVLELWETDRFADIAPSKRAMGSSVGKV